MKHSHDFKKPRPQSKVKVCRCGAFRHIITDPKEIIVAIPPKEA